jgi:hypothetical protein
MTNESKLLDNKEDLLNLLKGRPIEGGGLQQKSKGHDTREKERQLAGLTESQLKLELITKFKGMGATLLDTSKGGGDEPGRSKNAEKTVGFDMNNASIKQLQQL